MTPGHHAQDLGRLEGIVEMLRDQHRTTHAKLDAISGEITNMKVEAGKQGAVYGGAMSIGVALIIEGLKGWVGFKTGGGNGPG